MCVLNIMIRSLKNKNKPWTLHFIYEVMNAVTDTGFRLGGSRNLTWYQHQYSCQILKENENFGPG